MTPIEQWTTLALTAVGTGVTTLGLVRIMRKESRDATANAANLAAGHLNTLSEQLMGERRASEERFSRMQERADKLADKVDRLEREGQDRSRDINMLHVYIAELENVIRATGMATPVRPEGLVILPPNKGGKRG